MGTRVLAGALACWLGISPAAAVELVTPGAPLAGPRPVAAQAPALPPAPAAPLPTLAPAAAPQTPEPAAAPALPALARLSASPEPAAHALRTFDGLEAAGVAPTAVGAAAPAPRAAGLAPAPAAETARAPARGPPGPGTAKRRGPGFKLGLAAGIAAAALAPVLWNASPPLFLVFSLPAAVLAAGTGLAVYAAGRAVLRRALARRPGAGKLSRTALFAAGLAAGLGAGAVPALFPGPLVEYGARVFMPDREVRRVPDAFGQRVLENLAKNPEGRKALAALEDRGGKVRPPRFYLARLDQAGGFSFPVVDGVFVDIGQVTSRGWTVEEFLADPEKQRQLADEKDAALFHEVFHATQFRKPVQPGQLDRFPFQLFDYLTLEMEFEAHIHERLYEHAKLREDPSAQGVDISDYEIFLDDLDLFLKNIEDSPTYRHFKHVQSPYYRDFLSAVRGRHKELSVEGYELLARRYPPLASSYREKARLRARP